MENAGFVSRTFLLWVEPMIWAGAKRPLKEDEALSLPGCLRPAALSRSVMANWSAQLAATSGGKTTSRPSFMRALWYTLGGYLKRAMLLQMSVVLIKAGTVLLVRRLIQIVNEADDSKQGEGLLVAAGLFVLNVFDGIVASLATSQLQLGLYGCYMSTAILVLEKGTVLHPAAQDRNRRGDLVTLALSDFNRLVEMSGILMLGFMAPIMLVVAFAFMIVLLGAMVFPALIVVFVCFLIIHRAGKAQGTGFRNKMGCQGKRLSVLNEMLQSIRFTKFYVLEDHYEAKMLEARKGELDALYWMKLAMACVWPVASTIPTGTVLVVFGLYIFTHGDLPSKPDTFAVLAIARFMYLPFAFCGALFGGWNMFSATCGRVQKLLLEPEITHQAFQALPALSAVDPDTQRLGVSIKDQDFTWGTDNSVPPTLKSINLEVPRGELWAIVGELGSGKSSLLAAILGDIDTKQQNLVPARGPSRTYVAQQPMIINASVRQNVLFSISDVSQERLDEVYTTTALWPDLEVLPAGDETEIGEKGITLSGGQKARVALARAVLASEVGGLVLLDDPLAAVDAQVGKHLFEDCIVEALANTTRLLVTNQLHFLNHSAVSKIVVMDAGCIVEQGTWSQLASKDDGFFSRLIATQGSKHKIESSESESAPNKPAQLKSSKSSAVNQLMRKSTHESIDAKMLRRVTTMETKREGVVSRAAFRLYFSGLGGCHVFVGIVFCSWGFHLSELIPDTFFSLWSDDVLGWARDEYLAVWIGLGVLSTFMCLVARVVWVIASTKAARRLHEALLSRVIHCRTQFFDKTPSGQIMNRLGEDQALVDWTLPLMLEVLCLTVWQAFDIAVLSIIARPLVAPFIFVFGFGFAGIRELHRRVCRETIRWWMMSKSKIFNTFEEILSGTSTIFAFGCEDDFRTRFEGALLANVCWLFSRDIAGLWAEQRLALVGALVAGTLSTQMVLLPGVVNESLSSIAIISALQLGFTMKTISYFLVSVEGVFASAERIVDFTAALEQEPAWRSQEDLELTKKSWPGDNCSLAFEGVCMRYLAHMPRALDCASFLIEAREKVGIVGRTGSGKSTIMGVLFRLFELEQGRVLLGGVDIARMGVAMLRRQITIVPQDPILFSGELRKNLDPLCAKQDSELWLALRRCGLAELTEGLEGQLSAVVHEGGTNFSVGERQVICLARALLRDAHVLCLDEATANVDPISDKRIQQVLSKEISQCIVLTIAHRLRTVLNSDRILVLDTGKVAQLDTPTALLENPGIFHDLATQAGISTQDITEARCTGIVQAASVSSQNQEEASTVVSI